MKGRKPVPPAVKKVRGTYRPGRDRGGVKAPIPARVPRAPKWLNARARAEWARVARGLWELGLLTDLDVTMLAVYCQLYARAVEAEEIFSREGMMREDGTAHPCIRIARQSWSLCRQYATDFGATPSSRTRIDVTPPIRLANPFEGLDQHSRPHKGA